MIEEALIRKFENFCYSKGLSNNSIKSYRKDAELYIRFCKGNVSLDFKRSESIYHYLSFLKKTKKASTVERRRSGLVLFSKYYEFSEGKAIFNYDRIKPPKKENYLPTFYSQKESEKILAHFDKDNPKEYRNALIILFLFGTGLRASELINLKIKDINTRDASIRVKGKGDKIRTIYLPFSVLEEYINYKNLKNLKQEEFLFCSYRNKALSYHGLYWIISSMSLKITNIGLKKRMHPHAFRHSFATNLLERGADIRKISEFLGHKSLDTTQKYTHLTPDKLKDVMKDFHPHFKSATLNF